MTEICREAGISLVTSFRLEADVRRLAVEVMRRLKQLEDDNASGEIVADLSLDKETLQEHHTSAGKAEREDLIGNHADHRVIHSVYVINARRAVDADSKGKGDETVIKSQSTSWALGLPGPFLSG